jgi:hypothetical protein
MDRHKNAPPTRRGREQPVRRVLDGRVLDESIARTRNGTNFPEIDLNQKPARD